VCRGEQWSEQLGERERESAQGRGLANGGPAAPEGRRRGSVCGEGAAARGTRRASKGVVAGHTLSKPDQQAAVPRVASGRPAAAPTAQASRAPNVAICSCAGCWPYLLHGQHRVELLLLRLHDGLWLLVGGGASRFAGRSKRGTKREKMKEARKAQREEGSKRRERDKQKHKMRPL